AELTFEPGSDWLVAVDVQETVGAPGTRRAGTVSVRVAAAIEPEWLLGVGADRVEGGDRLVWDAEAARGDHHTGLPDGAPAPDEAGAPAPPGDETTRLLADAALARGIDRLPGGAGVPDLLARLAFAREAADGAAAAALPSIGPEDVAAVLRLGCAGRRSFA